MITLKQFFAYNSSGLHFYLTSCGMIRNQRQKIRRNVPWQIENTLILKILGEWISACASQWLSFMNNNPLYSIQWTHWDKRSKFLKSLVMIMGKVQKLYKLNFNLLAVIHSYRLSYVFQCCPSLPCHTVMITRFTERLSILGERKSHGISGKG